MKLNIHFSIQLFSCFNLRVERVVKLQNNPTFQAGNVSSRTVLQGFANQMLYYVMYIPGGGGRRGRGDYYLNC